MTAPLDPPGAFGGGYGAAVLGLLRFDRVGRVNRTARGSGANNTVVNNTVRSLPMGGDLTV